MSTRGRLTTVLVDAGGEPWSRVGALLDRRVEEIGDGGVIEVVTADAGVRTALAGWCRARGARLETVSVSGGSSTFRIRPQVSGPGGCP
ncbi:sulfurtransferase TusA family protein [Streptomyces sp. cmx-10-25]|uniref:sulfurtransferase TusA family protein n=1 Tax=Streptomyces sp. cmx-10-25 TaxID=2790919 RepID=UPI0039805C12